MEHVLTANRKKIMMALIFIIICLSLVGLAGQYSTYFLGDGYLHGFVPLFNLDGEMNIPTWFTSLMMMFSALLLWAIAIKTGKGKDSFYYYWITLSCIFIFFSLDDVAAMHEMLVDPLRSFFHARGFLYFSWVIVGAHLVFIFALIYFRFFFALPPKTRFLFGIAGILFIGGALGLELICGRFVEQYGNLNITYAILADVEEILEMFGLAVFISALLSHLKTIENKSSLCSCT